MSQHVRTATLARFKNDEISLLVCSDVAARGLDVESMSHVFNFDVPTHAEDYIHRIGRTGRAGREGRAFMISTEEDAKYIGFIEQLIGKQIPIVELGNLTKTANNNAASASDSNGNGAASNADKPRQGRQRQRRPRRNESRHEDSNKRQDSRQGKQQNNSKEKPTRGHNDQQDSAPPPKEQKGDNDKSVVGLGEHMPAFLKQEINPPPAPKAKRKPTKRAPRRKRNSTGDAKTGDT